MTNLKDSRRNKLFQLNNLHDKKLQAYNNVAQNNIQTITHNSDISNKRVVQIYKYVSSDGVSNTSLDFDLADEGQFIQEDSVSGTEFSAGKASLYQITPSSIDSYVKLLIQSEKTDGNTDITDTIGTHSITRNSCTHSTTQAKFGTSSIRIPNTPLQMSDHVDFALGTIFTIETYIYLGSQGQYYPILCQSESSWNDFTFHIDASNKISIEISNGGGYIVNVKSPVLSWSANSWHHIAMSRNGDNWYMFFDGVLVHSFTNSANWRDYSGTVYIGLIPWASIYLNAYIEDFRLSKGICRYTETFVAPNLFTQGEYTTNSYYITTSDQNNINLSSVIDINSCTITNSQPAGTSIKGLVSFDGRSTWSKWNGSSWVDSGLTDLSAQDIVDLPLDPKYKLVLNSKNMSNNSTIFTDLSRYFNIISRYGDTRHVTMAQNLTDTTSTIYFDGNGDYLTLPSSSNWNIGTNHTITFRIKFNDLSGDKNLISQTSDLNNRWLVHTNAGVIRFYGTNGSGTVYFGGGSLTTGVEYHIAIVKIGTTWKIYVNGIETGSSTSSYVYSNINAPLYIGYQNLSPHFYPFNGYMNSIIIANEALWTSNFTPPTILVAQPSGAGNTISEIQTGLTNLTKTSETYLDFAFDLSTADPVVTPYIDQITLNYDESGYYRIDNLSSYQIRHISSTQTEIKSLDATTKNIKATVLA